MSSAYGDLVVQNVASAPGSGTVTLSSAVVPYLTAAQAGFRDGDTVSYSLVDSANSESGYGVLGSSQTTLTRNPLFSTNSNAAINASASVVVRLTPLTRDMAQLNSATHRMFGGL